MHIKSTVRDVPADTIKVMIRTKRRLPTGAYLHTGLPLNAGISGEVVFWNAEPLEGLTTIKLTAIVDVVETNSPDTGRIKRDGELPAEIIKTGMTGAIAFSGVHVADSLGAPWLGKALAEASNVGGDPELVKQTVAVIERDINVLPVWLADVLKLLILAGTLFGIGFKLLELIFGNNRPGWAVALMCGINFSLLIWAMLFLFELGPYTPAI